MLSILGAASRVQALLGYEGLQTCLDAFSNDHPKFDRNVFLAMRFHEGKQHNAKLGARCEGGGGGGVCML